MNTKIDQLKEIAAKTGASLTADDKFLIKTISSDMGIDFRPRYNCKDCYIDQAVLLYKKLKEDEVPGSTDSAYVLKDGVDVIYRGKHICAESLTDDLAREMIALGFPKTYFASCE